MRRTLLLSATAAVLVMGIGMASTAVAGGSPTPGNSHINGISCFDNKFHINSATPGEIFQEAMDFGGGLNPDEYADKRGQGKSVGELINEVMCKRSTGKPEQNEE